MHELICGCGYDSSVDYERYMSLSAISPEQHLLSNNAKKAARVKIKPIKVSFQTPRTNSVPSRKDAHEKRLDLMAKAHASVLMDDYAIYSLGLISPIDDMFSDDQSNLRLKHKTEMRNKLRSWKKYGNVVAGSRINYMSNEMSFFWLLTDQHAIIVSAIPANNIRPGCIFYGSWQLGSNGEQIYESGTLSDDEFYAHKPTTLVIDNSVKELRFSDNTDNLYWVDKLILPSTTKLIPFQYAYSSDTNDIDEYRRRIIKCESSVGANLFKDGLQLECGDDGPFPYYIRDNIIYNRDDNTEAICLNEQENLRRLNAAIDVGVEEIKEHNRSKKLCQYCGEKFVGILVKKCPKCGKPKDY